MSKKYLLAEKTIGPEDLEDLVEWLETDPWLTKGPLCKRFEEQWSQWLDVRHAVFVNSGSSANLAMVYAALLAGKLPGKKVVVPAVSWATTVAPVIQLGLEPILCEADSRHYGLDLGRLEELLKEHEPSAVIAVHVLGVPNDMEGLLKLKERYGFLLLEDACAATGSKYDGKKVGSFGDMSTFSFFYGHHLSTIEGGMVCTDDEELWHLLVQVRAHGWGKDLAPEKEAELARKRQVLEFNRPFTFYVPGFNIRSTDLNARIGLSQMCRIGHVVRRRAENHRLYQQRFQASPDFSCQVNERAEICSISFAALARSKEHRARVAEALAAANIETRPLGGGNMSRQPFWTDRYGAVPLPMADRIHECCFHLPNHPGLTPQDIRFICDTVLEVKA
jgi:CDP-6-deoxy-D-xylo-4-hexulose-3-dehydrase